MILGSSRILRKSTAWRCIHRLAHNKKGGRSNRSNAGVDGGVHRRLQQHDLSGADNFSVGEEKSVVIDIIGREIQHNA